MLAGKKISSKLLSVSIVISATLIFPHAQAQTKDAMPLEERVLIASKIYRIVSTYFPNLSQDKFDQQYSDYIKRIVNTAGRREFDLTSMEFVAELHDGHTWFYDNWLDQNYGQPVGFAAYPIDGKWIVMRSQIDSLRAGDVIAAINGTNIEKFFADNRKYVSASSDRDAGVSFFDTPAIFPERFTIDLDDGRQVVVDRIHDKKRQEVDKIEGKWLSPNQVAYIKIPSFHGIDAQPQVLANLREFHSAKTIIVDVRGNPGLGDSADLQRAMMVKPYETWRISSSMRGGALLRAYNAAFPERSQITTTDAVVHPGAPAYSGRLILLIDRGCTCACEDFVMPFKFAKRAVLVGETTAGTFSSTDFTTFDNGMLLNVASIHHIFPDGSQFEGVGISPDVDVHVTPSDRKQNRDVVLNKALQLANAQQ